MLTKITIFLKKDCFTFLHISLKFGLIEVEFSYLLLHSICYDVILVEVYEENPASRRQEDGKGSIRVVFSDNFRYSFFSGDFIYLFLERRREGEREEKKHKCVRETSIACL